MRAKKKSPEKKGCSVPGYIVTFSDMITLLLTFFVLLLSMAEEQDDMKFEAGRKSVQKALRSAGFTSMGLMFSARNKGSFEYDSIQYRVDKGENEEDDTPVDPETEKTRRQMMDIEELMKITPSHIAGSSANFQITNINFEPQSWTLDESEQQFLSKYADELKETFTDQTPIIYVVGLATNESSDKKIWEVSARRAQETANLIRKELGSDRDWNIYSWGAGPGGEWIGREGILNKEAQIMIAVITKDK